jgi:hypothetical protein
VPEPGALRTVLAFPSSYSVGITSLGYQVVWATLARRRINDEHHPMSTEANRIVQKLWSYCTVLRDDGLSYGD